VAHHPTPTHKTTARKIPITNASTAALCCNAEVGCFRPVLNGRALKRHVDLLGRFDFCERLNMFRGRHGVIDL
jgi:hypothetical protein